MVQDIPQDTPAAAPVAAPAAKPAAPKAPARGRAPPPLLDRLAQLHPALFGARFLPLKIGVFQDLVARHGEALPRDELKAALGWHARSTRYLECVAFGRMRHDLDGQPVAPLSAEHVHQALMEIFRRRQARSKEDLRPWLQARLIEAIDRSGLARDVYLEQVHTQEPTAVAALDAAFAVIAERAAREEAWLRAYHASGASVAAFAEMYGLAEADVKRALQRERARAQPV